MEPRPIEPSSVRSPAKTMLSKGGRGNGTGCAEDGHGDAEVEG